MALTSDHTPLDQAEADRVLASGVSWQAAERGAEPVAGLAAQHCMARSGTNAAFAALPSVLPGTPPEPAGPPHTHLPSRSQGRIASYMLGNEPLGPPRVWLRDLNVPGLCMTRSFGDAVAATVGVIDSPEVVVHPLRPEDRWGDARAGRVLFCV